VAFNLSKYGLDKSDMSTWASSYPAQAFVERMTELKAQAFRSLLKDGEKKHSENAERYKAYEQVIKEFNDATKL
jgi:uncharacterized protein